MTIAKRKDKNTALSLKDLFDLGLASVRFNNMQLSKTKKIKAQSSKIQSTIESYTHVWPTRQRIKNRENRLLHIVEACIKHETLLAKHNNDKTFWKSVSCYLDEKFHFKKDPHQLRRIFVNFLLSKQSLSKALQRLFSLCSLLFVVKPDGKISLNSEKDSLKSSEASKFDNPDKVLCGSVDKEGSQPNGHIYYSPPCFETLCYNNIQSASDHHSSKKTDINDADKEGSSYNHEAPLLASQYQQISIISNPIKLEFPDWFYQSHVLCNQYTHFNQYLTLRNCIDYAVKKKNQIFDNPTVL